MHETLFISDLHLCDEHPRRLRLFQWFMGERASRSAALYLLGDLFDVWIGNDHDVRVSTIVERAIRNLVGTGTAVYFMHGNRDFLIERDFATRTGCELIEDPATVVLYGTPTLLTHGDRLCTHDAHYQRQRAITRTPQWREQILTRPLAERIALSHRYRRLSAEHKRREPQESLDVTQGAVEACMRQHHVHRLIHGHTHRPGVHRFALDGRIAERFVLAEWRHTGAVLCWTSRGYRVELIAPPKTLSTHCKRCEPISDRSPFRA